MAESEANQLQEGRVVKLEAIGNFLLVEMAIVMFYCCLNGIVLWVVGLNDSPAA